MSMTSYKSFAYDIAVKNEDGVTICYNYINDSTALEVTQGWYTINTSGSITPVDIKIPEEVSVPRIGKLKVKGIGTGAFMSSIVPKSIILPQSVTYIGEKAFHLSWLKSIELTDNVDSIGGGAFWGCNHLTSFIIPNKITSIRGNTFAYCERLASITIPRTVTSIGRYAFLGCSSLKKLNIPNTVQNIGDGAFTYIEEIELENGNINYEYRKDDGMIVELTTSKVIYSDNKATKVPDDIKSIGDYAFVNNQNITFLSHSNLSYIGSYAFSHCTSLQSVSLSNNSGTLTIGSSAFSGCTSLSYVSLPKDVEPLDIGGAAFSECSSLSCIIIPDNVYSIEYSTFKGCPLSFIVLGEKINKINHYAFDKTMSATAKMYLFNSNPPYLDCRMSDNQYNWMEIYVPNGCKNAYIIDSEWGKFRNIVEFDPNTFDPSTFEENKPDIPGAEKCATPTIKYENGKLIFECETEGAVCSSTITDSDIASYTTNKVNLTATYKISVYATKEGYNKSDVATATLCWIDYDPQTEGITNNVAQVRARAVMIQSYGNVLSVSGADEGTEIDVYDTAGKKVGSSIATSDITNITTSLDSGSIGIIKIGEKAVKVLIK